MSNADASPFSPRTVLAFVLVGAAVFVALLWMIGAGMTGGDTNDGGGHAGGKGLNGFAGMAQFLEARGFAVSKVQSLGALDKPGLLILTPSAQGPGKKIEAIVAKRRTIGPTIVIAPKWLAQKLPANAPGVKRGWVGLGGAGTPDWPGFEDGVGVTIAPMRRGGRVARWQGAGLTGALPTSDSLESGSGSDLVGLVRGTQDGRILAGFLADGGSHPALESMAGSPAADEPDEARYPLILVFEPDLLDNYGLADSANAILAERLVRAAMNGRQMPVSFDLTLNGYARSANLLTLAFTPPFLAATLCMLLAAIAVGWRAFLRFGPPRTAGRAIAFGKRALVDNAAGLIRRTRRYHLVAAPYADNARERIAKALALPRLADAPATEAAIDRALAARNPDAAPFSALAARLRGARRPREIVTAANQLHALERTLTR